MQWVRDYMLSIICAAIICSVLALLTGKNNVIQSSVKLLSGIFMAITVISPLKKLEIGDFSAIYADVREECDNWVASGEEYYQEGMCSFISEQTRAYILDKADSLGIDLQVEVLLSEGGEPIPWAVNLLGNASPYAREQLSQYIAGKLGIPKERQTWN